jgi:hypothetical protein
LENLSSGAHPSACPSHRARAHVPEFFSHVEYMSCTARHAPIAARHLIPAPSAVRSSPALHSVLLHVASFRQHRSPGIGLKPTSARAVSSSSPRHRPPQAAHGAALPRVAVFISRSPELHPTPSCAVRSPLRRLPPGHPAVSAVIMRSRSSLPSARGTTALTFFSSLPVPVQRPLLHRSSGSSIAMLLSELAIPPVPSFGAYADPHPSSCACSRERERQGKKARTLIYYLSIHEV